MADMTLNFGVVRTRCRLAGGFTLIEMMVAVAIVAIIAAVALPNYADYVRRSKISEAIANLSDMRTRLEQYFLDNRAYPTSCVTSGAVASQINLPAVQKYFTVSCTFAVGPPPTYLITATGVPGQGISASFVYTIDQSNARTSAGPAGWAGNAVCWAIRKNGTC